jgi:hypothetical protein
MRPFKFIKKGPAEKGKKQGRVCDEKPACLEKASKKARMPIPALKTLSPAQWNDREHFSFFYPY